MEPLNRPMDDEIPYTTNQGKNRIAEQNRLNHARVIAEQREKSKEQRMKLLKFAA
jgi:hypothetical protein